MPSDLSSWLISAPQDGDSEGLTQELTTKFEQGKVLPRSNIAELVIPPLKTGTLDLLILLSEELPKHDNSFTATVAKIVDTLRNLLNNDAQRLAQHTLVNEKSCDDYLLHGWAWNGGKYGIGRGLRDLVDILVKEMTSIDTVMKSKLNSYNLAKGSLVQMQRKKTGNLSVRSLAEVVTSDNFIPESEYLETVLVAVSKNLVKDWNLKYERLTSMIVPRSANKVAEDDEYTLFSLVIFRKVHDEFAQKCRENKFILRDFTFDETALSKQREELATTETLEKELWSDLLRLSRTNFSEAYQVLVHLKVVRLFVESVLRYGLPSHYVGVVIKPDPKTTKKSLGILTTHFAYLARQSNPTASKKGKKAVDTGDYAGEYATLMEQEFYDFVMEEVPWIVS